jgi:hypothetical protein
MIAIGVTGYILEGDPGETVAVDAVWHAVQGKSLVTKERATPKIPHLGIVSYPHLAGERSVYTFGAKVSSFPAIGDQ